jgi:hypothetical protein
MDSAGDTAEAVGCPIRKSTDRSLLAAPRGLSQRAASFIASQCQGIHQMPFRRLISFSYMRHAQEKARKGPAPPERIRSRCITDPTANRSSRSDRPVGSSSVTNSLHMSKIPYRPSGPVSVFSLADIVSPWSSEVTEGHPSSPCPALLVEADGIEPTTSCLQSTRSPN